MNKKKFLFVASTGGHLAQLVRLSARFDASPDSLWVTFDTPQSRSLLQGRRIHFVRYIKPRDYKGIWAAAKSANVVLKSEHFDMAVSTGAGLALAVLPLAKLRGLDTLYIESVSRVFGPSLTGRIIELTRSARLQTQYESWARGRWKVTGSVMEAFEVVNKPKNLEPRVFVTLGTMENYRFDALIDALKQCRIVDDSTVWQVGCTERSDLPGRVYRQMTAEDFQACIRASDVVITHAGVGTILQLLDAGVYPVVVPRDRRNGEHVDNHQYQIAGLVDRTKIGLVRRPHELTAEDLIEASGHRVVQSSC